MMHDFGEQRQQLVSWLYTQGIHDPRVLDAMARVPRELFVDDTLRRLAYTDRALPLSFGQTISQPLMVAMMTQALQLTGSERVLEIGTESGYQAAILSQLSTYVYSIERHLQLAMQASLCLTRLGSRNVSTYVGDGSLGWPDQAPYDRILVAAGAPALSSHLVDQLVVGGIIVIPIGKQEQQDLQVVQRLVWGTRVQSLGSCVFVPLVGQGGWRE